jgi:hypothetical protein
VSAALVAVIEQVPAVRIVTAPVEELTEQTEGLSDEKENDPVPDPPNTETE